jgi:hypothetical protein
MAALNFGSTHLQAGSDGLDDDDVAALRRALQEDDEVEEEEAPSSRDGNAADADANPAPPPRLFDRAFAAHALTPELAQRLCVPESERLRWAPRAALGDMLRHALSAQGGRGGPGGAADAPAQPAQPPRPLRTAELSLWFSCVDAERGGALVSLAEYRRGVEALRARVAAGGGQRRRALIAPPPASTPPRGRAKRAATDVTRGAGEGTSMAAAFGELVARHARW